MSILSSTTFKRILSALVALPIYLYLIITDSFMSLPILLCSSVISLICLYEFYLVTDKEDNGKAFIEVGLFAGLLVNVVMYFFAFGKIYGFGRYIGIYDARVIMSIILVFLVLVLILQIFKRPIKGGVYSISVTVFGLIYIVLSFSHIILIKAMANGIYYLILLNVVIMINDIGAYFGGVFFGKHKINSPISPNKSWEGYFSGLFFSIFSVIITNQAFISFYSRDLFTIVEAAILGIIISIFGNFGDLIESAIKRDCFTKDSGSIIPGHGGMWDVFDAMIFTLPLFYYFLVLIGVP